MLETGEVLVAEDSRLLLELLKDALLAHGIGAEVKGFKNGDLLLQYVAQKPAGEQAALYILDIVMPGTGGLELAQMIRALEAKRRSPSVPILFFSQRTPDEEIERAVSEVWPARFMTKEGGARPDKLALSVIKALRELLPDADDTGRSE